MKTLASIRLTVNGQGRTVTTDPDRPCSTSSARTSA